MTEIVIDLTASINFNCLMKKVRNHPASQHLLKVTVGKEIYDFLKPIFLEETLLDVLSYKQGEEKTLVRLSEWVRFLKLLESFKKEFHQKNATTTTTTTMMTLLSNEMNSSMSKGVNLILNDTHMNEQDKKFSNQFEEGLMKIFFETIKQSIHANSSSNFNSSSRFPFTEFEYYELEAMGESWHMTILTIFTLLAITSVILNSLAVNVLITCKKNELRKYLLNLSISDLLMSLLFIPFSYSDYMFGRWIFPFFLCPMTKFVGTLGVFVSAATLTVIGRNRYKAVVRPFSEDKITVGKSCIILAIWLVGIVIAAPEYLMHNIQAFCNKGEVYYRCNSTWPDRDYDTYAVFIFFMTFVIPLSLMMYFYTGIGLTLLRRQVPGEVIVTRDAVLHSRRVKSIKMVLVVLAVFIMCWLPLQTVHFILVLFPSDREDYIYNSFSYNLFVTSITIFLWLSMAHSCFNPLIYCLMNEKFKIDMRKIVLRYLPFLSLNSTRSTISTYKMYTMRLPLQKHQTKSTPQQTC